MLTGGECGRCLRAQKRKVIRVQPCKRECFVIDQDDDILFRILGRQRYKSFCCAYYKYQIPGILLVLHIVACLVGSAQFFGWVPSTASCAFLALVGALQGLNMIVARIPRMLPVLFLRFDFIVLFLSLLFVTVEISAAFDWSLRVVTFWCLFFPTATIFLSCDVANSSLEFNNRRIYVFFILVSQGVYLFCSHGNIWEASHENLYFSDENGTFGLYFSSATGNETLPDDRFSLSLHYLADTRLLVIWLFLLKALGKRGRASCIMIDVPCQYSHWSNLDVDELRPSEASGKHLIDEGHDVFGLSKDSIAAAVNFKDDDLVYTYIPSSGFSVSGGRETTLGFRLGMKISLQFQHAADVLAALGFTLANLALWGVLPKWGYCFSFLGLVSAFLRLLGMNTLLLYETAFYFNFLLPTCTSIVGLIVVAVHDSLGSDYSYVYLISTLVFSTSAVLLDCEVLPKSAPTKIFRLMTLWVCFLQLSSFIASLFLSSAINRVSIQYDFLSSHVTMSSSVSCFCFPTDSHDRLLSFPFSLSLFAFSQHHGFLRAATHCSGHFILPDVW